MLGEDLGVPYVRGITSWLRGRGSGPFVRPRFFTAYVEEAKAYLEERLGRPGEMMPPRREARAITHIPDTLYMVSGDKNSGVGGEAYHPLESPGAFACCSPAASCYEDIAEAAMACMETGSHHGSASGGGGNGGSGSQPLSQLPVVEQRILVLMKQREQELKSLALSNRALAVVQNRCEITKSIQLRVVREFGLPDGATEVLHNTASYVPYPATETTDTATDEMTASYGITGMVPSSGVLSNLGSNGALASDKDNIYSYPAELRMEACESPIPPMPHPSEAYGHYDFEEEVRTRAYSLDCVRFVYLDG